MQTYDIILEDGRVFEIQTDLLLDDDEVSAELLLQTLLAEQFACQDKSGEIN